MEPLDSSYEKTITVSDAAVRRFAEVTGDRNPLHLDDAYAQDTLFGERIAHGLLLGGYIGAVLGCEFPGQGTILMSLELSFRRPVRIGDTVTIRVTLAALLAKNRARLATLIVNQAGDVVVDGRAIVVLPPDFPTK
ncbi:MAG: MaoC family dehydratase [Thermoplasmatota archaeon]